MPEKLLDQLCINTIRTLAMDGVQKANKKTASQARHKKEKARSGGNSPFL